MQNLRELTLLLLRVGVGVTFMVHGWDKVVTKGIDGVAGFFASVNIPAPEISAAYAGYGELIFGALLVVGLATPLAALGLTATMAGAIYFVHLKQGFMGGYEFPMLLVLVLLFLAANGSGRFGLDAVLFKRRKKA